MIPYAGSVFLVVSIHILFQQKSYQLLWGICYISSILQFVSYLRPLFMYQALRVHAHKFGSGVPTGVHDSPRAKFTHFSYLGKMYAQVVRKVH